MTEKVLHTLAALKFVAYGGPIAVGMSALGGGALAIAFWDRAGAHYDVAVVGGVTLLVGAWVEFALARRFAAHEKVEQRQYERVASVAEGAAIAIVDMTKATREHTVVVEGFRREVGKVSEEVSKLGQRVKDIEDRFMRPAMLPSPRGPGAGP